MGFAALKQSSKILQIYKSQYLWWTSVSHYLLHAFLWPVLASCLHILTCICGSDAVCASILSLKCVGKCHFYLRKFTVIHGTMGNHLWAGRVRILYFINCNLNVLILIVINKSLASSHFFGCQKGQLGGYFDFSFKQKNKSKRKGQFCQSNQLSLACKTAWLQTTSQLSITKTPLPSHVGLIIYSWHH